MHVFGSGNDHQSGVSGFGADGVKPLFPNHILHVKVYNDQVELVLGVKNFQRLGKI